MSDGHFKALAGLLWVILLALLVMSVYVNIRLDHLEAMILEGLSL